MASTTAIWNELHLAEEPAVDLLTKLGYTYVPSEDLLAERGGFGAKWSSCIGSSRPRSWWFADPAAGRKAILPPSRAISRRLRARS